MATSRVLRVRRAFLPEMSQDVLDDTSRLEWIPYTRLLEEICRQVHSQRGREDLHVA